MLHQPTHREGNEVYTNKGALGVSMGVSDQSRIWEYFQNEGIEKFDGSIGRLSYIARLLKPGTRALNIGVGNGALEAFALDRRVEAWSLDPSERAIESLKQRLLPMRDRAFAGFAQTMPFPDGYFDDVVLSEVLEHLEPDVFEGAIAEVARVLKPGGRMIATVPAREKLSEAMVVCPCCSTAFHRWGHTRSFTVDSLIDLLRTQFTTEQAAEHFFVEWSTVGPAGKLKGLLKQLLSWRGIGTYGAGRTILYVGRKLARQ
jgi:SAM-dependent methyltransferase